MKTTGKKKSNRTRSQIEERADGLSFEQLELRQMLAVTFSYNSATDRLVIQGDAADDQVNVRQVDGDIWVYAKDRVGVVNNYWQPGRPVTFVEFHGEDGRDSFVNNTSVSTLIDGGNGNDYLRGGAGNDFIYGQSGNDYIVGLGGIDFLSGGSGLDWMIGGPGDDTMGGGSGGDVMYGDAGDDTMAGDSGNDWMEGRDGSDRIEGGVGDDVILGDAGIDDLFGDEGNDWIEGRAGDDRINAGPGDDVVGGGVGSDNIIGGTGTDNLWGDSGDDVIAGSVGSDLVNLGSGTNDVAQFIGNFSRYTIQPQNSTILVIDNVAGDGTETTSGADVFRFADGDRNTDGTTIASRRITVQPIVASNSNGTNTAEWFGNAIQRQTIMDRIDDIFAQADVDVLWLAPNHWFNSFANVGVSGNSPRPGSDLGRITTGGDAAGVGSSDPLVLDMYFVEISPFFRDTGEGSVNGYANQSGNGSTLHVGDNLLSFALDTIADVAAHEIGHNLGLQHITLANNLMQEGNAPNQGNQLTNSQIATIWTSPYTVPT